MATMTLKEKAHNIAVMEVALGGYSPEAWTAYAFGIPLAIALDSGKITVEDDSEWARYIEEVYDWLAPARAILDAEESAV